MSARVGRPVKKPSRGQKRVSLGLRVKADIKRKLDAEAVKNGRSQSQEAEFRIERTFEQDWLLEELRREFRNNLKGAVSSVWNEKVFDDEFRSKLRNIAMAGVIEGMAAWRRAEDARRKLDVDGSKEP